MGKQQGFDLNGKDISLNVFSSHRGDATEICDIMSCFKICVRLKALNINLAFHFHFNCPNSVGKFSKYIQITAW